MEVPTIKEIAKRLNISTSTVSRALHDHKSIGLRTKTRVQQLAKELGYEANKTAIFFQQKKTFTIGVILPELSEAFFAAAISGIEDAANKNNYIVLMGQSHDDEDKERRIVATMKDHRVDGLIVSIAKKTTTFSHFETLEKYGIPIVFFDRIPTLSNIHYVACNMKSGTVSAVDFLLKKGHRIIGMLNGPERLFASQERKHGYIDAMTKKRLKYDPNLIVNTNLTKEGTQQAMKELFAAKRKPDAIVAFNDYVLLDAVQYARQQKMKINEDVTFVSYANLPFSIHAAYPPLASVEQYPYLQGQKATELLFQIMAQSKEDKISNTYIKTIIEPKLIVHSEL